MLFILFKFWNFGHIVNNSIDTDTNIAILLNFFNQSLMLPFFLTNNRSQNLQTLALWQFQNLVYNLFDRRSLDGSMSIDTVGCSYTCIEETEIVVDFRRSTDSRTWIFTSRFLVNGNSRTKTIDRVHIWFLHIP